MAKTWKRYAVRTSRGERLRTFWTKKGARRFWVKHWLTADLLWWSGDGWINLI